MVHPDCGDLASLLLMSEGKELQIWHHVPCYGTLVCRPPKSCASHTTEEEQSATTFRSTSEDPDSNRCATFWAARRLLYREAYLDREGNIEILVRRLADAVYGQPTTDLVVGAGMLVVFGSPLGVTPTRHHVPVSRPPPSPLSGTPASSQPPS